MFYSISYFIPFVSPKRLANSTRNRIKNKKTRPKIYREWISVFFFYNKKTRNLIGFKSPSTVLTVRNVGRLKLTDIPKLLDQ